MILADTHIVVWLAFDSERISRKAKAAIDAARNQAQGLAIASITLMELAALASKKRIRLNISLESFLAEVESRFMVLPMTGAICARAVMLPDSYPADPADRMIAATALVEGIDLVTADGEIRRSRIVKAIW